MSTRCAAIQRASRRTSAAPAPDWLPRSSRTCRPQPPTYQEQVCPVPVCQVGQRSATVVDYLLKNGWVDVSNIEGGMDAWERAGLPVKRGAPTAEELGRRP